jgi:hypothetical protein
MGVYGWHVDDDDLLLYVRQGLAPDRLWSADAHLAACGHCRERLAEVVGPVPVAEGWARLDAELDAPRRGPVEWVLVRMGVADSTARLLMATPALRRSWLVAVTVTLVLGVVTGHAAHHAATPLLFLVVAPLLPVAGVAWSFGAGIDPRQEMSFVTPMHGFRLLLIRTVSVLATTMPLSVLASLALPSFGLMTLAWLLPSFALTSLSLALIPRLGSIYAPGVVGVVWIAVTALTSNPHSGTSAAFTGAGQAVAAVTAICAVVAITALRDRFDAGRSFPHLSMFRRTP